MCVNASPLKNFIAQDFNDELAYTEIDLPDFPLTNLSTIRTVNLLNLEEELLRVDPAKIAKQENWKSSETHLFANPEVEFEAYREGIKSWFSWQDPFILVVFILLALLSTAAIVAFKVL